MSLVALGTVGLHAAASPSGDGGRFWSVSGTLDGFYDDNINSTPNNQSVPKGYERGSTGFQVTPAISLNWPWEEQTTLMASYAYTFKYYGNKPVNNSDNYDQIHNFSIDLEHSFNENYNVSVKDSFVIGQEPDLLRTANTFIDYARVAGDNIRNLGSFTLDGRLTPLLGFELGYANALYDYADDTTTQNVPTFQYPSTAGILNRIDQTVHLDSRWQLAPDSTGVVGYQFVDSDYTADQQITATGGPNNNGYYSDGRNSRSHYGYVGVDHQFQPAFSAALRVGAHYTDYYNDPTQSSDVSPYVQLSLHYGYAPESYLEGGFTYDRAATDLIGQGGASGLTVDSQSSVLYATLHHRLAPKLIGLINAQFQNSEYNGGSYNGKSEQYYTVGLSLEYKFNANFSTHLGYNYDRLDSEAPINRGFDRNRVYLGITATY